MIHTTIVNVGYRSTNYWVISAGTNRVLVDLGWPGMIGALKANLDRAGVPLAEIRYAIATHYHIDHAGAAEDLKRLGVPLMVLESQVGAIPMMKQHTKPQDNYTEITSTGNLVVKCADTRALFAKIGIAGEVVPTTGHSDDSVTVVLDEGAAFTGDLTPMMMAEPHNTEALAASWQRLRDLGVKTIYPGHGPSRRLEP